MVEQSTPASAIRWPNPILNMRDLFIAMRAGFDLTVEYTDKGGAIYRVWRGGVEAPAYVLVRPTVARAAHMEGRFGNPNVVGDGRSLLKLTTKSTGVT